MADTFWFALDGRVGLAGVVAWDGGAGLPLLLALIDAVVPFGFGFPMEKGLLLAASVKQRIHSSRSTLLWACM
jgi:hypothetical protein